MKLNKIFKRMFSGLLGVSKRILFSVLTFVFTVLVTACGSNDYNNQVESNSSYDSKVDTSNTTTAPSESKLETTLINTISNNEESDESKDMEMGIKAVFHDTSIAFSDTNSSFINSVNEIIATDCVIGLELQEALNDSKINKYCSEGYCVQIQYAKPQTYELSSYNNAKSLEINKIYLLVDTENNQSLIGIVCGTDTKLYHMSKESVESIINCLI